MPQRRKASTDVDEDDSESDTCSWDGKTDKKHRKIQKVYLTSDYAPTDFGDENDKHPKVRFSHASQDHSSNHDYPSGLALMTWMSRPSYATTGLSQFPEPKKGSH